MLGHLDPNPLSGPPDPKQSSNKNLGLLAFGPILDPLGCLGPTPLYGFQNKKKTEEIGNKNLFATRDPKCLFTVLLVPTFVEICNPVSSGKIYNLR